MVGDIITVNGVKLLVLDELDGNPFVLAFDLDEKSAFNRDNAGTDYSKSLLQAKVESWFDKTNIKAIDRKIDLTTMTDYTGYGELTVKAVPLTFDEYRKYAYVIKSNIDIKGWFWTATAWSDPDSADLCTSIVCRVNYNGLVAYTYYTNTYGRLVPAFILDKSEIRNKDKATLAIYEVK